MGISWRLSNFMDTSFFVEALKAALTKYGPPETVTLIRVRNSPAPSSSCCAYPHRCGPGPLNVLVDSTGIEFLSDGEWLARKHGTHCRRQYRKVHLAMDTATGDIRAVESTSRREGDSPVLPDLLDQIPPGE